MTRDQALFKIRSIYQSWYSSGLGGEVVHHSSDADKLLSALEELGLIRFDDECKRSALSAINLSMEEIERLMPAAAKDIIDEFIPQRPLPERPTEKYLERERARFDHKLDRFNVLARAWLEYKMGIIST